MMVYRYYLLELHELDIELFYLGPTEGEKCETQLVLGNFLNEVYVNELYKYLFQENIGNMIIVGSVNKYY